MSAQVHPALTSTAAHQDSHWRQALQVQAYRSVSVKQCLVPLFSSLCFITGCTKAFSQLSNLQSHSRCHQTDKPYKCNSCYKCFADEQSLFDHIPKHKESKHIKTHICSYCGKSYTQVCNIVTCMAYWRTVYSQTEIRIGSKLYRLHGKECELNQAFFATF